MTAVTEQGTAPSGRRRPRGRHAAPPHPLRTAAAVLAVLVALAGAGVLLFGPVRSALDAGATEQQVGQVATDATCFRFSSLEARVAAGRVRPEELRRRGSDLAIGAQQADPRVATAASRLADELTTDQLRVDGDAWTALADACQPR